MVFFCFRMEAWENIGTESAVGDDSPDSGYSFQVPFAGIFTVHQFQDAWTSALYGQVDVLAYIGYFCDDMKRFVTHVFGVWSGETYAHVGHRFGYDAEQHGESYCLAVFFKTVWVDVLSQQGYFLIAFSLQVAYFVQDTFHVTAAFTSACIRHNTVMAEIVASSHDGNEAWDMVSANTWRNHVTVSFRSRKFHIDGFFSCFYSSNQVG